MRKLMNLLFISVFSPCLLAASVSRHGVLNPDSFSQPGAQQNQSLTLNSQMFGYHGPLSIGTEYSQDYGVILTGQYTQKIGQRNALSLIAEGGAGQRRLNATWALLITQNQRIKLSVERLVQRMKFDFDSGRVKEWVPQNAYGATYEYFIKQGWLNDVSLNAFYSRANSKNFNPVIFSQNALMYENFRHIAGGTDKSVSLGSDFFPTTSTKLNFQVNYDNVHYNEKYNTRNHDSRGLGLTLNLHQLITKRIRLNLLASTRTMYNQLGGEVSLLVPTRRGTALHLNLKTTHTVGLHGVPNNNVYGVNLAYSWGLSGSASGFSLQRESNVNDLASWAATPAVKMPQVLAVLDQRTVAVPSPRAPPKSGFAVAPHHFNLYIHPGEKVNFKLNHVLPPQPANTQVQVAHLPEGWHYDAKNEAITAQIHKKIQLKTPTSFSVQASENTTLGLVQAAQHYTVTILAGNPSTPYANSNSSYGPYHLTEGQAYQSATFPLASDNANSSTALYINLMEQVGYPIVEAKAENLPPGITLQTQHLGSAGKETISFSGTPNTVTQSTTYLVSLEVKNGLGNWNEPPPKTITFIVAPKPKTPTWDKQVPPAQSYPAGKSITVVDMGKYFSNPTGNGELTFDATDPASIAVTTPAHPAAESLEKSTLWSSGSGIHLDGNNLTGIIPTGIAEGKYTIHFVAKNSAGFSNDGGPTMTLNVQGKPVWTKADPVAQVTKTGAAITNIDLSKYFTNPANSGDLTVTTEVISPDNKTNTLKGSTIGNNGAGLHMQGTTLEGTVPATALTGTYKFHTIASNSVDPSADGPTYTISVPGIPVWNKQNPANQAVAGGGPITAVDLAADYSNPQNSGALSFSGTDADSIAVTAPGASKPETLSASKLGLTLQGSNLSGKIAATAPTGVYTITFNGKNDEGFADKSKGLATFTITVSGIPVWEGKNPGDQTIKPGSPFTAVDMATYFTNPTGSGDLTFKTDDAKSISVQLGTGTAHPLNGSNLFDAGKGITLSGTSLSGTIPANATPGVYTIRFAGANTVGTAGDQAIFKVTVTGVPVWDHKAPSDQKLQPSSPITAVEMATYFTTPAGSGAVTFDASDSGSISVSAPGAQPTSLAGSTLSDSGKGITLNGTSLSGTLPAGLTPGEYTITFIGNNSAGRAGDGPTFKIIVTGGPVWNGQNPADQNVRPASPMTSVDLGSYFTSPNGSGAITFNGNDTKSITVEAPDNSKTTLQGSKLYSAANGITLSGTTLQGTVPSTATPGIYTITFAGKNDVTFAPKTATFKIVVAGVPVWTNNTPGDQQLKSGAPITGVDMATYFTSPKGNGAVTFDPKDSKSISVTFSGNKLSLEGSNLFDGGNGITLNGISLSGTIPATATPGVYDIHFAGTNNAGLASNGPTFKITVLSKPVWDKKNPANVTLAPGAPMSGIGLATYFSAPQGSGAVTFDADNSASISVTLAGGSATSLNGSGLKGGVTLTGTQLGGKIPTTAAPGIYTIKFKATNDQGLASDPATFTITVSGTPVWNGSSPAAQKVPQGKPTTTVDLASYFVAPSGSGVLTFNDADKTSIQVTEPDGATTATLTGSKLGLTLDGTKLTGSIAAGAPTGVYTITFDAKNDKGYAPNDKGQPSFTMTVTGLPAWTGKNPGNQTKDRTIPINDINLASYFNSPDDSGNVSFDPSKSGSIMVTYKGSTTSLEGSSLWAKGQGIHLSGNTLTGSIPATAAIGDYTITFKANNDVGTAPTGASFTLTATGVVTLTCPTVGSLSFDQKTRMVSGNVGASNGQSYAFSGKLINSNNWQGGHFSSAAAGSSAPNNLKCVYTITGGGIYILNPTPAAPKSAHFINSTLGAYDCTSHTAHNPEECKVNWNESSS